MRSIRIVIISILVFANAEAWSAVLDFESLTGVDLVLRTAPYIEDGFILTTLWENDGTPEAGNEKFESIHPGSQFYAGSVSFIARFSDDFPILTRQGGGGFDLISIDLDSLFTGNANVEFTGILEGGGTIIQSFVTDSSKNSMETFSFSGFTNIVSLSWENLEQSTLHHFDNIVVAGIDSPKNVISIENGFIRLDITGGGAPSSTYCEQNDHYGRLIIDEVNERLYICTLSGWVVK